MVQHSAYVDGVDLATAEPGPDSLPSPYFSLPLFTWPRPALSGFRCHHRVSHTQVCHDTQRRFCSSTQSSWLSLVGRETFC
jgi:hypothetical protein